MSSTSVQAGAGYAPLSAELRNCVVCGLGSHRTDWMKRSKIGTTLYVACDSHTDQQMSKAIDEAETAAKKPTANPQAAAPSSALQEAAKQAAAKK